MSTKKIVDIPVASLQKIFFQQDNASSRMEEYQEVFESRIFHTVDGPVKWQTRSRNITLPDCPSTLGPKKM